MMRVARSGARTGGEGGEEGVKRVPGERAAQGAGESAEGAEVRRVQQSVRGGEMGRE